MIVIDPTFTIAASKADLFVPIHPGTDGALALAMANVLVNEGLAKEDFLKSDTRSSVPGQGGGRQIPAASAI